MKPARIAVLGIAGVAGLMAFMLSGGEPPPAPQVVEGEIRREPTTEILVTTADVPVGGTLTNENFTWRAWPDAAIAPNFVRRTTEPEALERLRGSITRFPLAANEPIISQRLIRADGGGFMAAMLPAGMRAIAVPITPETGAGGFILPNDRVDVLLTRRERQGQTESIITDTILANVRVMAIDQTFQERDGEKVVVGRTATMELNSRQAETVSQARQMGEISLALRSLADSAASGRDAVEGSDMQQRGGSMSVVRFGITTQVPVMGR
jgi:pilus assembly protein CpaB